MKNDVVAVEIRGILPANSGCAIFVGNEEKVFVILVDPGVGAAIMMSIAGASKERPLTDDLVADILQALGARTEAHPLHDLRKGKRIQLRSLMRSSRIKSK